MDSRAAKLALARKKLKDHQEKKSVVPKDSGNVINQDIEQELVDASEDSNSERRHQQEIEIQQHLDETFNLEDINFNQNLADTQDSVNVTEILITNKRNIELQVTELQSRISQLEFNQVLLRNDNDVYKQQIITFENQVKKLKNENFIALKELQLRDNIFQELNSTKSNLTDENNDLQEQLEFTKTMLTEKESENSTLNSHLSNLQNQLDLLQLQLQQLTSGSHTNLSHMDKNSDSLQNSEMLLRKISGMEQQMKTMQKEKDQINLHYEHYVNEINEQLKSVVFKNDKLVNEIQILSHRENSLVEQISEMEIRLQNYHTKQHSVNSETFNVNELQQEYNDIKLRFQELSSKFCELQTIYAESETQVKKLSQMKCEPYTNDHIPISMTKLNADITSDKVAVQRATEQNKKLKIDLHELEEAFVKISKDKLEFTEKLDAEKFLNRELTIKLSEVEEKAKDLHTKLVAKDDEMIRLQTSYREIKTKFDELLQEPIHKVPTNDEETVDQPKLAQSDDESKDIANHGIDTKPLIKCRLEDNDLLIPKEHAMLKLQKRFLKIMSEVADLSDEKHRLEHIILQLQNETDTICEYVALYQEQRELLKKRDEERSTQVKIFQSECELLKSQLEELSAILTKLSNDKELSTYFENEARNNELIKVMNLLSNLKNSSVIDPKRECSELKDFYPCHCCSGKLIDV